MAAVDADAAASAGDRLLEVCRARRPELEWRLETVELGRALILATDGTSLAATWVALEVEASADRQVVEYLVADALAETVRERTASAEAGWGPAALGA